MMIWKHSSHCMVSVLQRTVFIVFCYTVTAMQIAIIPALVTCYLFFRCGIEKESLSRAFSATLPHTQIHTHNTHTYRLLQAHLFFSDPDTTHARTFLTYGLSIFLEMFFTLHAWRDFRVEVVPGCPFLVHYMFQKTRLESCAGECSTYSIIQALMESSGHACTSWWRPGPFYPCSVP